MKKGDAAKTASGKWVFWLDDLGIDLSREFDVEDDAKAAGKAFLDATVSAEAEKAAIEAEEKAKAEQDAEWARLQRNFNAMKARSDWQRG